MSKKLKYSIIAGVVVLFYTTGYLYDYANRNHGAVFIFNDTNKDKLLIDLTKAIKDATGNSELHDGALLFNDSIKPDTTYGFSSKGDHRNRTGFSISKFSNEISFKMNNDYYSISISDNEFKEKQCVLTVENFEIGLFINQWDTIPSKYLRQPVNMSIFDKYSESRLKLLDSLVLKKIPSYDKFINTRNMKDRFD